MENNMDNTILYEQLWNSNDKLAKDIANNDSILPSLRAIAYYILRDYSNARTLYKDYLSRADVTVEGDIYLQELQLMLEQLDGQDKNKLRTKAESIISQAEWLVFSRILIAGILESEKEYQRAIEYYKIVLTQYPSNVVALAGLTRSLIQIKESDSARKILKGISTNKSIDGLEKPKRIYWQLVFFSYWLLLTRSEMAIIIVLSVFIMAFFSSPIWIFPALMVGFYLFFAFFFRKKYGLDFSILIRFSVIIVSGWLVGYGIKMLFDLLMGIR